MSKFLITGGAGFIGSNFCQYMVQKYPDDMFLCLDVLTYAADINRLKSLVNKKNFRFIKENICNKKAIFKIFEDEHFDYVVNFAAESHVDRSIEDATLFIETNVIGTEVLLDVCRQYGIKRFHQVSTDEVYGQLSLYDSLKFNEASPLNPSNPYSASKAAADLLVLAYHKTFGIPITISRSSNNFGPNQHFEKFIPKIIINALNDEKIPIYGNGNNVRDWLYVIDNCQAIDLIIRNGKNGNIYNIGAYNELCNFELVKYILKLLDKKDALIEFVEDRPGHDVKYALNSEKIIDELGWKPNFSFEEGIIITINYYKSIFNIK